MPTLALSLWVDKLAYDEAGETFIHLVKGSADPSSPAASYEVDGLAGATLTGNGVSNLMRYWLGKDGFGPFLAKVRAQEAS